MGLKKNGGGEIGEEGRGGGVDIINEACDILFH